MQLLPKRTLSSIVLVATLVVMLVVLAVLQYLWSGKVSEAENERMHISLQSSMNQFRMQFNNEFQQLVFLLQPDAAVLRQKDWNSYAASCITIVKESDLHLVRNIYLWVAGGNGSSRLLELNKDAKSFDTVLWPSRFEMIRERYGHFSPNPLQPGPENRPFNATMFYQIPLMLQPLIVFRPQPDSPGAGPEFAGYLMLELNREIIHDKLLPELAKKYFGGPNGFIYQLAITSGRTNLIYQSDLSLGIEAFEHSDARINLLESPRERFGPIRQTPERGMRPPGPENPGPPMNQFRPAPPSPAGRRIMGFLLIDGEGSGWELAAKHREGSLEAAVDGARRRNLAISFGILILLAASMALIIALSRRMQRLARLQIDFVAGISHELRTPLAVICSAGDNLAEGVIESHCTRKYGELIRNEGRKLAGMIDQILQFAGIQRFRRRYNLRPENAGEIVNAALKQAQPLIAASEFSVEKHLTTDLPGIRVDSAILMQAIFNLIQNALKYSGDSRWLSIKTQKAHTRHGDLVQIVVEDRGIGIDSEDLPHIFDPFYRGSEAAAAQIHGAGLGLYIVREALTSMGGNISVKSSPGKGSVFTIHLPALMATDDSSLSAADKEHS